MAEKDTPRDVRTLIKQFRTSDHWAVSLARDLLWVVVVVGAIALALYLICGTWPAVVTIESKSMEPNMHIGDLVVVVQKDRYGEFMTWDTAKAANLTKFSGYGDVIIYKPNGLNSVHPIIHRTITQVTAGTPVTEIRGNQLKTNYTPDSSRYITWGDNNPVPDQFAKYPGIGTPEPVKDEWIVGKSLFSVPLVGYLPLHIWEVIAVVIIIMILHELYLKSRETRETEGKGSGSKKKTGKNQKQGCRMTTTTTLLDDVLGGHRLTTDEATLLMKTTGRDVWKITTAADEMRERRVGNTVTYVRNQNLHVTNICKNLCGFGRKVTDEGACCMDKDGIQAQARMEKERGVTEICLLSGVHPGFTLDTYCDLMDWIHEIHPGVHIHAFSPDEVAFVAKKLHCPTPEVLDRLKTGGLGTIQGTAAEILWDVQDETHGFTELVTLPFIHTNTPIYQQGLARAGPTSREDLLMLAVSRLFLDNFNNIGLTHITPEKIRVHILDEPDSPRWLI